MVLEEKVGTYTINWFKIDNDTSWPAPEFRVTDECGDTVLTGFIKWDDCGHLWFGEDDKDGGGYVHMCGRHDMENWVKLLNALFEGSKERWGAKHIDY